MNFKDIVKKVKLHSGFQGLVASVEATDYTEYLAEAVRSNWVDIQNQREDWKFMWEQALFNTSVGTSFYSDSYIMGIIGSTHSVAKWKTDGFYKGSDLMTEISYDEYISRQTDLESTENTYFAVKEYRDSGLYIPTPTTVASIKAPYYRTPQILTNNGDTPLLPEEFHYIIVYRALEDVAAYLGNPSIYERHSYKHDVLENKLMRSQIPSRKVTKNPIYRGRVRY